MNTDVVVLAALYGVPLSERSVAGNYQWDGQTLGTRWQRWAADCKCGRCRGLPELSFCPVLLNIRDHDIVHDIAHHIVAEPWQRDLPEWGLGMAADYGANGGYHLLADKAGSAMLALADGLWGDDNREPDRQESVANLVGYILMQRIGVKPPKAWARRWADDYATTAAYVFEQLPRYGFSADQGRGALRYMARPAKRSRATGIRC
jgi:hypothetical protein